jgi:hypothetical protein
VAMQEQFESSVVKLIAMSAISVSGTAVVDLLSRVGGGRKSIGGAFPDWVKSWLLRAEFNVGQSVVSRAGSTGNGHCSSPNSP